ncbi:hypothetical protein SAMN05216388_105512 [Halorientalis persicus]|uniref:Uncharacterized protein n=1 Tax=Halorientalis persicus TaxID=1367881 RepID=A0A1H8WCW3_9EURY|nr:hypothetical protein [Halorientalis persicus]SEP25480.1 hypothetical protein SAMN05216388_105512 [Halorientalis persicus]
MSTTHPRTDLTEDRPRVAILGTRDVTPKRVQHASLSHIDFDSSRPQFGLEDAYNPVFGLIDHILDTQFEMPGAILTVGGQRGVPAAASHVGQVLGVDVRRRPAREDLGSSTREDLTGYEVLRAADRAVVIAVTDEAYDPERGLAESDQPFGEVDYGGQLASWAHRLFDPQHRTVVTL